VGAAEALAILAAATAAGGVNAAAGSGSLITFPTLLAFGFPAVTANVSNNVGLVPGNVSGAFGYRRELAGQRGTLLGLGAFAAVGSLAGAILLLSLPARAFTLIVPVLILVACVLVIIQPRLNARMAARRDGRPARGRPALAGGVFVSGAYGGYFGAAQGVLVIGLLGSFLDDDLQRINAAKNILVAIVNAMAAVVFLLFAQVNWVVVLLIAAGSAAGGLLGARVGRRLPPAALRIFVVLIGVVSAAKLIFF